MMSPKIALVFGTGAGIAVGMIEVAAGVGLTGNPILDGLLGGTGVTLVTAGVYKYKVDRIEKDMEKKVDRHEFHGMEERLGRIEGQLDRLVGRLLDG